MVAPSITDVGGENERIRQYVNAAFNHSRCVILDRRSKRVHSATLSEDSILDLARAVEATLTKLDAAA